MRRDFRGRDSWVVPNEPEAANKMTPVDWFLKMGATVATVDEAIKFVQDKPKGIGDQGNYIFADAQGNMAAVEVGYQTVNVVQKWTKGEKGIVARANRLDSAKMKPWISAIRPTSTITNISSRRRPGVTGDGVLEWRGRQDRRRNVEGVPRRRSNRDKQPLGDTGFSIANHGSTGGT